MDVISAAFAVEATVLPLPFRLTEARLEGRLGTGGILVPNGLLLENKELKPEEMRRVEDAIVAKPSRMLPLDAREVSLGAWE